MLTFNRLEDLSEEMVKVLRTHLRTSITGFSEVFNEWPAGNFTIKYPSASIMTVGDGVFSPSLNKPIVLIDSPVVNNEALVLRNTGFWEFDLQIDLWCRNKNQRTQYLRFLEEVLDPDTKSQGLSGLHLTMPDYYNSICSYTYTGFSYEDSEISAQRREWRAILRVKADARSLRDKLEKIMTTTVIDLKTKNTAEDLNT